jgi:phosphatidylserine synthase
MCYFCYVISSYAIPKLAILSGCLGLMSNIASFGMSYEGNMIFNIIYITHDRLCGLVARVLGYRSGGPGSIPDTTKKK